MSRFQRHFEDGFFDESPGPIESSDCFILFTAAKESDSYAVQVVCLKIQKAKLFRPCQSLLKDWK